MAYRNGQKIDSHARKLLDKGRPPAVVLDPKANLTGWAEMNRSERRAQLAVHTKQSRLDAFNERRRARQQKERASKRAAKEARAAA